jgi:hypothetical protein
MDFKTYQKKARETAQYPDLGSNNIYPTLGLVGEAGEVAEKVKKVIRDKNGIFDNESKLGIKKRVRRCFVVCIKSLYRIKFQFRGCCITKP